jgi:hypothetical protein
MKTCRSSSVAKILTSSTSGDGKQQSKMHGTTKHFGIIINSSCIIGNSVSGTYSYGESGAEKGSTSSPPAGGVPSR